jgi:hypothetical protein
MILNNVNLITINFYIIIIIISGNMQNIVKNYKILTTESEYLHKVC